MQEIIKDLWKAILFVGWLGGIVIADGYLKIAAILIPFYSWYLFAERIMRVCGLV